MKYPLTFILLICCYFSALSRQTLDLKPGQWHIRPGFYYISEVRDERTEKENAGHKLVNGKQEDLFFSKSLEEDLFSLISQNSETDTMQLPVFLSVITFKLEETGTEFKHKAILNYVIKFFVQRKSKSFELYELSGSPQITASGNVPGIQERLIQAALKQSMESFHEWIGKNRNQMPLMRYVKVIPEKSNGFQFYEKRDTILWCPNQYKLSWKDFLGTPPESDFSAQSNCMFIFVARPSSVTDTLNLYVQLAACFARTTSWVKTGITSDTLLGHEQLHFDICEWYLRKLRKKLIEYNFDPIGYSTQFQPLFNEVWQDYQKAQMLYDDETQHGLIADMQLRWENDVEAGLNEMKKYSMDSCE